MTDVLPLICLLKSRDVSFFFFVERGALEVFRVLLSLVMLLENWNLNIVVLK
jgi:hypothetical protein